MIITGRYFIMCYITVERCEQMEYQEYLVTPLQEENNRVEAPMKSSEFVEQNRSETYRSAINRALFAYGMTTVKQSSLQVNEADFLSYPPGVNNIEFKNKLEQRGLTITEERENLAEKAFNIQHHEQPTVQMIENTIKQIGEVLEEMGHRVTIGAALKACREILAD